MVGNNACDSNLFHTVADRLCLDDEGRVSVEFRLKPCSSPNTNNTTPAKLTLSDHNNVPNTVSSYDRSHDSTLNKIDPFSGNEISEAENVLVLHFEQGRVAVDKNRFEQFVLQAEKDGKSFNQLTLHQVEFAADGTHHDFTLSCPFLLQIASWVLLWGIRFGTGTG